MAPLQPLIYAELLSNIRQISVITALDTPCDASTKVKLSEDGQEFILLHHGDTQILRLPGQVVAQIQLLKPTVGKVELSWRLPLAGHTSRVTTEIAPSSDAPWSAKVLGEESEFSCRNCGSVILEKGSIKASKDLPSENWAEMMDFWHCHKPDLSHEDGSSGYEGQISSEKMAERGYGANSKFAAQPGVVLVDITTFVLSEADCSNIQLMQSNDAADGYHSAHCINCQKDLGYFDPDFNGIRISKWTLECGPTSNGSSSISPVFAPLPLSSSNLAVLASPFSASIFISSKIASIMSSQLVSKVLLMPRSFCNTSSSLLIWIFGASIRFSCSGFSSAPSLFRSSLACRATGTLSSVPAMKVFWKPLDGENTNSMRHKVGIEDLLLPLDAMVEMEEVLRESAALLPPSSRKFQGWDVGLLERHEE